MYFEHITQVDGCTQKRIDIWTLKRRVQYLQDVLDNLSNPFIVSFEGIPEIRLSNKDKEGIYNVEEYLLSLARSDAASYLDKLQLIATEDTGWTKIRNKDLEYTVYRKFTLDTGIREIAMRRIDEAVNQLKCLQDELKREKNKKTSEKMSRHALYRIGDIYIKQFPKGGENGVDGYLDAEIINSNTNEITRFVVKDIFDFGTIVFPKRVGNSVFATRRNTWSEEEVKISDWLNEFNPFTKEIRM